MIVPREAASLPAICSYIVGTRGAPLLCATEWIEAGRICRVARERPLRASHRRCAVRRLLIEWR